MFLQIFHKRDITCCRTPSPPLSHFVTPHLTPSLPSRRDIFFEYPLCYVSALYWQNCCVDAEDLLYMLCWIWEDSLSVRFAFIVYLVHCICVHAYVLSFYSDCVLRDLTVFTHLSQFIVETFFQQVVSFICSLFVWLVFTRHSWYDVWVHFALVMLCVVLSSSWNIRDVHELGVVYFC